MSFFKAWSLTIFFPLPSGGDGAMPDVMKYCSDKMESSGYDDDDDIRYDGWCIHYHQFCVI